MKIVHVETGRNMYGGAQQALYLCRGLLNSGVATTLVCEPDSSVDSAARASGIPVHNLPCGGDFDLGYFFRLKSYLLENRPDIVHVHSRRGADVIGGRATAALGIPSVLTRRVDSVDSKVMAGIRYRPYKKLVAISENVAGAMRHSGVADDHISIIRSAVDVDEISCDRNRWQQEFGIDDNQVVAVIVAQLIERKGHRQLLEALPDLCKIHDNFRLLVFGRGPLDAELRRQTSQLGLDDHVRFVGFRDDLDDMLGCADILVHPASMEGLGVAMLKGAAAGLPVVAFDVAGAKEAVVHDETGILVTPGSVQGLLHALSELIENPKRRQSLGRAGQKRMRDEFSIDVMVSQYAALYRSVLHE